MVVFEHIYNSVPQKLKVFVGETGGFARKICGNISVSTVKRIGNNEFFAHGVGTLFTKVFFGCLSGSGNGYILLNNRVYGAGEAELNGSAYLTAVELCGNKSCHDGTEGANVKIVFAHKVTNLYYKILIIFCSLF